MQKVFEVKIVHVEDWFHPEMGYQINYLAKYHNPAIEFHIVTSDCYDLWPSDDKQENKIEKDATFEKNYNVKIHRLPSLIKSGKHNRWLLGLHDKIREIDPDVVFAHCIESFTALRIILNKKIRHKYKIATDTHTLYSQFGNGFGYKAFLCFMKYKVVSLINRNNIKVFYTAEENQEILKTEYRINNALIKNSNIATDLSTFYNDSNSGKEIRHQLDIPDNAFMIIYTGKVNHLKQPHILLEALQQIDSENVYVVFVGAKNRRYYDEVFKPLADKTQNIRMIENQKNTELYKFYSAADLAVFPKQNTLSALDAQACKLPVIMENDFTNKIRLKQGGLLYQQGNISELADSINRLRKDTELRKKLALEGYQFIKVNYNYKKIIANVEKELYI